MLWNDRLEEGPWIGLGLLNEEALIFLGLVVQEPCFVEPFSSVGFSTVIFLGFDAVIWVTEGRPVQSTQHVWLAIHRQYSDLDFVIVICVHPLPVVAVPSQSLGGTRIAADRSVVEAMLKYGF